jgi:putative ABC transport system substrate-binding protein
MRRREVIALVGSAAAWPLVARAQHPGHMRRIGMLMATVQSDPGAQASLAALRQTRVDRRPQRPDRASLGVNRFLT